MYLRMTGWSRLSDGYPVYQPTVLDQEVRFLLRTRCARAMAAAALMDDGNVTHVASGRLRSSR